MALSRIALAASLMLVPAPAFAQPDPADEAIARQREIVRSAIRAPECDRGDGSELVVCGRSPEEEEEEARRFRVAPTAVAAERAGGSQRDAMAANDQRCTPIGRAQQCSGGLDILGIGFAIVRTVQAIRARRD